MAAASVTPRVRNVVICDEVYPSATEDGVFTLEGVRQHLRVQCFPCRVALSVFLVLSCPRKGRYSGKLLIVNERTDKPIRYVKFRAVFAHDNELVPMYLDVNDCVFPEEGQYNFEVYFAAPNGNEALKGEHPFNLSLQEE